jgi:hypothetical protein
MILISIRLATYGEMMSTPVKFSEDFEMEYQIDLRVLMDRLMQQIKWDPVVSVTNELTVFVRPLNYKHISQAAIKTFETQKIMQVVNDDKMPEEQKIKLFKESFKNLSDATLGTISDSIFRIDSVAGSTDNPEFIAEFVNGIDKEMFNVIQKHLEALRDANTIKPMSVDVTPEMKERGVVGDKVEIPITFDPSTFFV